MADPLSNTALPIEDIITPESVDVWPLAIGWWLLLALSIALIIGFFITRQKYKKKWEYRKQALALLEKGFKEWEVKKSTTEETCQNLLTLLKRTAMTAYPDQNISSLHGEAWLTFLNSRTPSPLFNKALQDIICTQQYQRQITADISLLKSTCEQWIKQHSSQWELNKKGAKN